MEKYHDAVEELKQAKKNHATDGQVNVLQRKLEDEKLKFSVSGFFADMTEKKRTKKQLNEKIGKIYYCLTNY